MHLPIVSDKIMEVVAESLYKAMLVLYIALFFMLGMKAVNAAEPQGTQVAYAEDAEVPSVNRLDTVIAQVELNTLLDRLVINYEEGNLDAFVSLFDRYVKTEDSVSRDSLREQYEELFSKTNSRFFLLHGIEWNKSGNKAVGIGDFQVKLKNNKGKYLKSVFGKFKVEVIRKAGKPVITKFIYQPA